MGRKEELTTAAKRAPPHLPPLKLNEKTSTLLVLWGFNCDNCSVRDSVLGMTYFCLWFRKRPKMNTCGRFKRKEQHGDHWTWEESLPLTFNKNGDLEIDVSQIRKNISDPHA